ncbi:type 1 fimbrial protein [Leclercia sp. 29361]|uniref:fimbrial protein n=1 Tax=Leclercia sp. 29361 TaxID=2714951 RepID=UPI0014080060|nr:fimbrial protein [Leclercia sp. 29361]QIK13632.1 type 1 fimbrial protein [Leclercia sp. 29361]
MRIIRLILLLAGIVFPLYSFGCDYTSIGSPYSVNYGNIIVNLGDIQAKNMATPGSLSTPVPFTLSFSQCPEGTRSVTTTFTGTTDPVAGGDYYKNSGSAENIALGIIETRTGNIKGSGQSITQTVAADRTLSMAMQAVTYSQAGGVTPGTIAVAVAVTLQYN